MVGRRAVGREGEGGSSPLYPTQRRGHFVKLTCHMESIDRREKVTYMGTSQNQHVTWDHLDVKIEKTH